MAKPQVPTTGFEPWPLNLITTDYTLALSDANGVLLHRSGPTFTITIPPNSLVAFPVVTPIRIINMNNDASTNIVPAVGVTLKAINGQINAWNTMLLLMKLDTDYWIGQQFKGV